MEEDLGLEEDLGCFFSLLLKIRPTQERTRSGMDRRRVRAKRGEGRRRGARGGGEERSDEWRRLC